MEGYIEVLVEDGEAVPESDSPEMAPRYDRLAQALRDDAPAPRLEQISSGVAAAA